MVTMAKGIGNGWPLGAVTTRREIAEVMGQKLHFNTFAGQPVAMMQGLKTLEVIDDENLQQRSGRSAAISRSGCSTCRPVTGSSVTCAARV